MIRSPAFLERSVMSNNFSTSDLSEPFFEEDASMLLEDRRRRERTPALQEGTHIWLTGSRRVSVELVDESPSGIGIVIPNASFDLGPHIDVEYQGERRTAIVAYLKKNEDGQYRLGLEWASRRKV